MPREASCGSCSSVQMVSPELVPPAPSISGTGSGASQGPDREAGCVKLASISNLQRGRVMKLQSLILRNSLLFLTSVLVLPAFRAAAQSKPDVASASAAQAAAVPARITQAIDETQLVRLRGNVHPLARLEFDQGMAPDATPMSRMLLLLRRSPEQEAALQEFIVDQQIKDSPSFRKWLTP